MRHYLKKLYPFVGGPRQKTEITDYGRRIVYLVKQYTGFGFDE